MQFIPFSMLQRIFFLFIILPLSIFSQVVDDFSDGNFTFKPNWIGTNEKFEITNLYQLRTKDSIADTAYLVVNHGLQSLEDQEWHCWIRQSFSPSGNNFSRFYLTSTSSDLTTKPDGYYLQLGESGSMDAIRLMKSENHVSTEICMGTSGAIATNFIIAVKVTRDKTGNWKLYVDYQGGENYVLDGSGNDKSNLIGNYAGFFCKYTKTYASRFYFDNVYIGPKIVDKIPPTLQTISVLSSHEILLQFNEAVDTIGIDNLSNYVFLNSSISVIDAQRDSSNFTKIYLYVDQSFVNATLYSMTINHLQDVNGNELSTTSKSFYYLIAEKPSKGDVLINECMANPSPTVGLPELEYIEIYNASSKYFNIQNWIVTDGNSVGKIANAWLAPHTYILLCNTNSLAFMNGAIGVSSFPSLNNDGDKIQLKDSLGLLLDEINFNNTWYHDEVKSKGGYSLERINPYHPCSNESNWKVSQHPDGGTPGMQNSLFDTIPPSEGLQFISIQTLDSEHIELTLNRAIDTSTSMTFDALITPNLSIESRSLSLEKINIRVLPEIQSSKEYSIILNNVKDCWQRNYSVSGKFSRTESPEKGDVIINEILFHPYAEGADFVELKNVSSKWIALDSFKLGNLNQGKLTTVALKNPRILKPNEIVFITKSIDNQAKFYAKTSVLAGYENDLPAYNIDSGSVLLFFGNQLMDKVSYSEKWHYALISDPQGKSLERISVSKSTQDPDNWKTAAETYQFASPGIENSHLDSLHLTANEIVSIKQPMISPDNDGVDDILKIEIHPADNESYATISVYSPSGVKLKSILKNTLLAANETIYWDGINELNQKTPIGTYIIYVEILSLSNGNTTHYKIPVYVVGKL